MNFGRTAATAKTILASRPKRVSRTETLIQCFCFLSVGSGGRKQQTTTRIWPQRLPWDQASKRPPRWLQKVSFVRFGLAAHIARVSLQSDPRAPVRLFGVGRMDGAFKIRRGRAAVSRRVKEHMCQLTEVTTMHKLPPPPLPSYWGLKNACQQ